MSPPQRRSCGAFDVKKKGGSLSTQHKEVTPTCPPTRKKESAALVEERRSMRTSRTNLRMREKLIPVKDQGEESGSRRGTKKEGERVQVTLHNGV